MSYLWCVFIEDLSFQILKPQTFTPVAEHFSSAIDLLVRLCKHDVLLSSHAHTQSDTHVDTHTHTLPFGYCRQCHWKDLKLCIVPVLVYILISFVFSHTR